MFNFDKLPWEKEHEAVNTIKLRQPYFLYLLAISLAGLIIVIWGLSQIPAMSAKSSLILIICLAVFADIFASSSTISDQAMAIEVGTAVSMALIPLFGPAAAAVSAAACSLGIWLVFPSKQGNKKRTWEQLSFNAGMLSVSMFIAGITFLNVRQWLGPTTFLGQTVPWFVSAVVYDQINFWMLMGIIRLKQGAAIKPVSIWKEHLWALPINILILCIGGGSLAFAAVQLGLSGIFVFFLPVLLSAYAFRLYVHHMQSHLKNLENIVAERTDALQKAMEEKDAFLAVLTHDMKSPLTSIHLYASMIKEYPRVLEQKPHMIDAVLHSQETLIGIVNNILDIEKLEANGKVPIEKEIFEFSEMATAVCTIVRAQSETKQINLQLIGNDTQIFVYADRGHMERVLHNLLNNAVKYTPHNGEIKAVLSVNKDELCLKVQDSGYGIPEDELPFVFDRFHRVTTHEKVAAGTGLGLTIAKALVEAHDGRIEVTSEEGKGSLFTAYLPIIKQPVSDWNGKKKQNGRSPSTPLPKPGPTFISYWVPLPNFR